MIDWLAPTLNSLPEHIGVLPFLGFVALVLMYKLFDKMLEKGATLNFFSNNQTNSSNVELLFMFLVLGVLLGVGIFLSAVLFVKFFLGGGA